MALMNTDDLFYTQVKCELLDVMVKLSVDIDAQDIGSNDCNTVRFSALHYTYNYRSYMTRAHFQRCMQSLKEVWSRLWRLGGEFPSGWRSRSYANEPSIDSWSGVFFFLAGYSTQAQEVHRIRKG